ncbi:hypothetical protein D9C73_004602 [Collichthys lucidus]|uniref:Uncharacterized protein n=1 Tax=Collichthys lucidus TaxID=240159 RepID=A0A4U5U890_COLLU|nr:hypothetical protein D9C73_004602 [Collichthys lucidus]
MFAEAVQSLWRSSFLSDFCLTRGLQPPLHSAALAEELLDFIDDLKLFVCREMFNQSTDLEEDMFRSGCASRAPADQFGPINIRFLTEALGLGWDVSNCLLEQGSGGFP